MKVFFEKNYPYFIYTAIGIVLIWVFSVINNPKPNMSELDKYKLEQIQSEIDTIIANQKRLDKKITDYKNQLTIIDSTIGLVKNQKITVKEYYRLQGEEIGKMTKNQIDSLLHKRYKF